MKETFLLFNVLTWGSVFWLIADVLRAQNDGKLATQSAQGLHFKRSQAVCICCLYQQRKGSSCSICCCSLALCVITGEAGGSLLCPFVVSRSVDFKYVFLSVLGKQEVFDVTSVRVHSASKIKFSGTLSWSHV